MKLISMHADNFGCLHNYDYNFEEGLNVVLHDNGWGKTTMAAFLKAMLYGFDSKRSKDITENERKRYLPWQGGNYGGSLDFESEGVNYRIFRTFGETPKYDRVKILNLNKKATAGIDPEKIGETLFKLDVGAFRRSVFINRSGPSVDGAASSIHTRLNSLVSQANDVAAYDGAIADLTQQTKIYEKSGGRGQIGDITGKIDALERRKEQLERDIAEQDKARTRISEIDVLLGAIGKDLEGKKKRLDEVSGEVKKKEASKKLLDDLNTQIAGLQQQIDAIRADLGGSIPSTSDVDSMNKQNAYAASLAAHLKELDEDYEKVSEEYRAILNKYDGVLPTASQLDKIRGIYGELQGAMSAGIEEAKDVGMEPEGYTLINAASEKDSEYVDRLKIALATQTMIQDSVKKLESQDEDVRREIDSWEDKKKRYGVLKASVDAMLPEVEEKARYRREKTAPVISKLEYLQKMQQSVDVRKEDLTASALTAEQEALIQAAPEILPDTAEGNDVLRKYRDVIAKESAVDGLTSRLDGEKSKAESLKASVDRIDSMPETDTTPVEKPKKSVGGTIIGGGAAVAVIGAILGFAIGPIMAFVIAIGVVLAVLGIIKRRKYKVELKEHEAHAEAVAVRCRETQKRRDDLLSQLNAVQNLIDTYEAQIAKLNNGIAADRVETSDWFAKWGSADEEISEAAINDTLRKAELIKKLRAKKQEAFDKQKFVDESTAEINAGLSEAAVKYPEIAGKSIAESLSALRSAETDYKIKAERLEAAEKNLKEFLDECEISVELFAEGKSPRIAELKKAREETSETLERALADANEVFAHIGLTVTPDNVIATFRDADRRLSDYLQYADKLKERYDRQCKKQNRIDKLNMQLETESATLRGCYAELDIQDQLAKIREDVAAADKLKEKVAEIGKERGRQTAKRDEACRAVNKFTDEYGRFAPESENILEEIRAKVSSFTELDMARKELEKQKSSALSAQSGDDEAAGAEERELRGRIATLEGKRDQLLVEYTQKSDFIRQADRSLEEYPDVISEMRQLYDQKQKAQNTLVMLKRTIRLIIAAKENLADRYLGKVEDTFNNYMRIWLNNDALRGILDIDFNVAIEENDKAHVAEGYSAGYCDLIDFCMRLALVDTLFESEQPFLILDDPFVNLDADRLDKALALLNVMAANKQIIYFVCHPIRAVETNGNSASRAEFAQLADAARKALEGRRASAAGRRKIVRKSPKEMYTVVNTGAALPFRPAKPNYTITNNIFSMSFTISEQAAPKDNSYELFFIDAVGHVLNERQMLEISGGRLSVEKVQFCLNTRDDSGNQYELMIRESGRDDYEVIARIPFKAKLAFAGTDSFGF